MDRKTHRMGLAEAVVAEVVELHRLVARHRHLPEVLKVILMAEEVTPRRDRPKGECAREAEAE